MPTYYLVYKNRINTDDVNKTFNITFYFKKCARTEVSFEFLITFSTIVLKGVVFKAVPTFTSS